MKRRCVFLDRDGVINVAPKPGDYILRWEDFEFIPTITDWIRLFNTLGYLVIVVTNQRCVARGMISREALDDIHRRMIEELAACGARIDDVYCCPHENDACDCRKPKPGMVESATAKWNIDLAESMLIGDSPRDRGLALATNLTYLQASSGQLRNSGTVP
jgi:D-glycero-D-manno-heptose 1,7-bisphosphate phosphatase